MAKCIYCGQEAGFLRRKHRECEEKHRKGRSLIYHRAKEAILNTEADLEGLKREIDRIAAESFIGESLVKDLLVQVWEEGVTKALEDDLLTEEEEKALEAFRQHFGLSQEALNRRDAYTKVAKAALIRDVLNGRFESRVEVVGSLPFNLQKSEVLLWLFTNVKYYQRRTRRRYVGGYQGVSVRIAKGVYYRVGAFRGNPVDVSEIVHVDTGLFGVTTKHIYFAGEEKAFRIPYKKMVTITPYSDGVGIQRDAMNARPQIFVTGDGWFTYNLIVNLAEMSA